MEQVRYLIAILVAALLFAAPNQARAETFVVNATLGGAPSPGPLATLGANDILRINFSDPFGATGDEVVLVQFSSPGIQFNFRAGRSLSGASTTLFTQNGQDSSNANFAVNGIAFSGCGLGVGCNFIEIEAVQSNNPGSTPLPLVVSGVALIPNFSSNPSTAGSAFVSAGAVVSSASEPGAWTLMIAGFLAFAVRLKSLRPSLIKRGNFSTAAPSSNALAYARVI